MKRQQRTVGAFLKIDLEEAYHTYARILKKPSFAFYDIKTKDNIENLDVLENLSILFIIAVYDDAVTKGRWIKIGKRPLEPSLKKLPLKFMQDKMKPSNFSLYNPNNGEIVPATKEQCKDLERAAVWEPEHVEDRLRDHFAGRPNKWVESLKINS
jgi:hypothetical protein